MGNANVGVKKKKITIAPFSEVAKFHGHTCPGLTLGYMAAEAGINALSVERDVDEELVTIIENDACGVDAVQVVTGCTMGKGNLIFQDHGKQVYTFINRANGDAVRVALKASFTVDEQDPEIAKLRPKVMSGKATKKEEDEFHRRMEKVSESMRAAPVEKIFSVKHVKAKIPEKARIFASVKCSKCGEMVAESRARVEDGGFVCIPCHREYNRGW
jgi:formylmethanofuran dehydrogenase subunit E